MGLVVEDNQVASEVQQEGGVEGYTGPETGSMLGGKRRKGRKGSRGTKKGKKGSKVMRKRTRKGKRPPSKWILHVKAFCKKTGKNFPQALKDPMCKKTFKH
tara:strand:- start:4743 stop:5045 length:303 start_codon:yes stop_codon:yes gene_type:complete